MDGHGHTYLVNENSEESAGWYSDEVADVLLRESNGWHRADPETGAVLPDVEAAGPDEASDQEPPADGGESEQDSSGTGRKRRPPQAETTTPGGGDADEPKE